MRNDAGYNNAEYDKLVKDAVGIADPKARMASLEKAEKIFLADLPIIPILHYKTKHMVSKKVAGLGLQQPGLPSGPIHVDPVVGMS